MQSTDEDDWETADISSFAPPKPSLRAVAPSFQPRAVEASASTSRISPHGQRQRIHAPPGREGGGSFVADKQAMRADWEAKAGTSAANRQQVEDGEGDEWFRAGGRGQSNRQLWDEANTHNAAPTTFQIITPTPLPPPQIKILRRQNAQSPSSSDPSAAGQGGPPQPKTYKEKEEQYRLARERIFGPGAESGEATSSSRPNSRGTSPLPVLVPTQVGRVYSGNGLGGGNGGGGVSRQPRGPGEGSGFGGGGFGAGGAGQTVPPPLSAERGQGGFPPGW